MTRRGFLGYGAAAMLARAQQTGATRVFAYVGSYTTAERKARGDGIHVYSIDATGGGWTHVQHVGGLVNPSYLTMHPEQRCICSVHGDETYATSFGVDPQTGKLSLINRVETGGRNGVHSAFHPAGRFVVLANYATGQVAVLPVDGGGKLSEPSHVVTLTGEPGPHRVEQNSSHPHHVIFDPSGRYVLVPDKGRDRIFVFHFDAEAGKLTPTEQGAGEARAGAAPRHAAFHPTLPVLWVANEINSTVTTYQWDLGQGSLRAAQILPSLPSDYTGRNSCAEIDVSQHGRFVYVSNRGHDSVAIFSADPKTGLLASVGWEATRGRVPRFIGLGPAKKFLYVANEQGDTIISFRADADTGRLTLIGKPVQNASPVTIAFAAL
jgi:6-phosphogluconolactonase (cycloisomerase 2 family)